MKKMSFRRKKGFLCRLIVFLGTGALPLFAQAEIALGDVNGDGNVMIIDALMIAQYYVGLNPTGFITTVADVTLNGTIDIIDALIVAQYYVGLIKTLPPEMTPPPSPTSTALVIQTPTPGIRDNPFLGSTCYVDLEWSALAAAPAWGEWNPAHFEQLLQNAYPQ